MGRIDDIWRQAFGLHMHDAGEVALSDRGGGRRRMKEERSGSIIFYNTNYNGRAEGVEKEGVENIIYCRSNI